MKITWEFHALKSLIFPVEANHCMLYYVINSSLCSAILAVLCQVFHCSNVMKHMSILDHIFMLKIIYINHLVTNALTHKLHRNIIKIYIYIYIGTALVMCMLQSNKCYICDRILENHPYTHMGANDTVNI